MLQSHQITFTAGKIAHRHEGKRIVVVDDITGQLLSGKKQGAGELGDKDVV